MEASSHNQHVDILESTLDQAFAAPPSRRQSAVIAEPLTPSSDSDSATVAAATGSQPVEPTGIAPGSEDIWKAEYEAQVQSWRAQSAEAREKAEKERLKWEAIRAIEKEEAAKRKAAGIVDEPVVQAQAEAGWEKVGESSSSVSTSTTPSETTNANDPEDLDSDSARPEPELWVHSRQDTVTDESQKWEDVPSVTSSFPSMSFPEHNDTTSPPTRQAPQQAPLSVTSAIFDSSLSNRTRLAAFFSSLGINLLLPFVNGVMLGFGEIFAKNVVMEWLGWKPLSPGSVATMTGLREQRQRQTSSR
ncbi:hypothetical protein B0H34DRAFT_802001 [Crassisporium funariophilum]|nr:hypothetical protein B0H34DRAFT_802001 [Crassisporium funariophilum]